MSQQLRIIVTGLIAQYPMGGMTWHYLQYLLGLQALGHDVFYLEDSGSWPYDPVQGMTSTAGCRLNVEYLQRTMEEFGFADRWAYLFNECDEGKQCFGMSMRRCRQLITSSDLVINVSGSASYANELRADNRLVYIDTDPLFTQVHMQNPHSAYTKNVLAHDTFFTFAENPDNSMPDDGVDWQETRQPVVLEQWRPQTESSQRITTVMNWTSYSNVECNGVCYGQKDREFMQFLEMPASLQKAYPDIVLELAIGAGKTTLTPYDSLRQHQWSVIDAYKIGSDPHCYRDYIESSLAEWSVAKHGYVAAQTGWFSERSACYLAAGKPVLMQDTGFSRVLPTGKGLLAFTDVDTALAAFDALQSDVARHQREARELAHAYFDASGVLGKLLEQSFSSCSVPVIGPTCSRDPLAETTIGRRIPSLQETHERQ